MLSTDKNAAISYKFSYVLNKKKAVGRSENFWDEYLRGWCNMPVQLGRGLTPDYSIGAWKN